LSVALDLIAPVLVIAWAIGRLLGPQLMYQGGGYPTHAWYGMAYAGQAGKRVPVPIIQALEDAVVYVVALWVERRIARRGGPIGIVATTAVTLYGAARFNDEYVLLPHNTGGDIAVLIASVCFVGVGAGLASWLLWKDSRLVHDAPGDPWRAPTLEGSAGSHEIDDAKAAVPVTPLSAPDADTVVAVAGDQVRSNGLELMPEAPPDAD
jgi:prolipoprotein diacylglyceryltransferase